MSIKREQLTQLLKDKAFRAQFASDQPSEIVPLQIRRLRERQGWTQGELGQKAGVQQEAISRWENPDNKGITLNTLSRLAQAFDVALIVRFAPFSELIDFVCNLSPASFEPVSFDEELPSLELGASQTRVPEQPQLWGAAPDIRSLEEWKTARALSALAPTVLARREGVLETA
jgi:transcriptional regulator with XRE-family HTH domain